MRSTVRFAAASMPLLYFAVTACTLVFLPACAQVPPATTPPALTSTDEDLFNRMLRPRSEDEVKADLSEVERVEKRAETQLAELKDLQANAKARVDLKKSEMETLKQRIKLAQSSNDKVAEAALKQSMEQEKEMLAILERMSEGTTKGIAYHESQRAAAKSHRSSLERELEGLSMRTDRLDKLSKGSLESQDLNKLDADLREKSKQIFAAHKDYSEKLKQSADAMNQANTAKVELVKAWIEYQKKYAPK